MPFCTNCGNQNPDTSKFCTTCGAALIQSPKTVESGTPERKLDIVGPVTTATSLEENVSPSMENKGQNVETEKTTINFQVPSVDNIASRRPLIPMSFALAIIFFFFTFCDFKCGGQKIGSITGFNLVTGTELKDHDMITGREIKGKEVPASIWAIFAFGAAVIGLGAFLIKEKRESLIGTAAGGIGTSSLIILQFAIKSAITKDANAQIDVDFQFPYWAALLAFCVAGLISYLRMRQSFNIAVNLTPPIQTNISSPTEDNSAHPQVQPVLQPSQQIAEFDIAQWFKANTKKVFGVVASLLVLYLVYYFILKNDPVNDGKKAALSFCDCNNKQNQQTKECYKKFIADFDSYKFSGREAAKQKLSVLVQSVIDASQGCYIANQEGFSKLSGRYIGDKEKTEKFNYAYNAQLGLCNNTDNGISSIYNQANNKIAQYISPLEKEQARRDSIAAVKTTGLEQQFDEEEETEPVIGNELSNSAIGNIINGNWNGSVYQASIKKSYYCQLICNVEKDEFKYSVPGCSGICTIERVLDKEIDFRTHVIVGKGVCYDGVLLKLIMITSKQIELLLLPNSIDVDVKGVITKQ